MSKELTASSLKESELEQWDLFVDTCAAGSVYSLAKYLDTLCSCAGGRFNIVAVRSETGSICGGIALYEPPGIFRTVSNRLLLYYNGLVLGSSDSSYPSEQTSVHLEIMRTLETYLSHAGYDAALLHSRAPINDLRVFLDRGWSVRPGYTYEVEFENLSEAWKRVEKNLRRLINRATDAGYSLSSDDDFESFFRLHSAVSERKDAPVYLSRDSFQRYYSAIKRLGLGRLYHARSAGGECGASQLVLHSTHKITHTVCAGSSPEHMKIGANPFLRWRAFEALAREGYTSNDLTDAALNPVTHFKSQLGGILRQTSIVSRTFALKYALHVRSSELYRSAKRNFKKILGRQ